MTCIAVVGTAGIVGPAAAGKGCGGMTRGAIQAGRNMRRHGVHHACRRIAVVAGSAVVNDTGMIEGGRYEGARVMADAAILVGLDMTGFFGCGETGAMTGRAVICYARVTEARGLEAGGLVAVDAIAVGRHVEVALADGSIAVMTGCAIVDDTLVVKTGAGKGGGVMAHRAIPACVLVDLVIR